LKEELEIASFDFIGELIKGNKLCMTLFEIQMGHKQIMKIIEKVMKNVVNSNLFFRSVMISIIYFFDQSGDIKFIENSLICKEILKNSNLIVMKLLDEVKDKSIDSNNKSTVITCLMTAYMLKHLNK
jgi:hypothetical protein